MIDETSTPTASGAWSEAAFSHVLTRGGATRADLGAALGLSAAAVTRVVRPLLGDGLLRERDVPIRRSGAGRPARVLEVVADRQRFVGVKVTRDRVVAVATDLRATVLDGVESPLPRRRRPAEPLAVDAVIPAIVGAVRALGGRQVSGLGVAVSGDVNTAAGRVELSPLLAWRDVELRGRLYDALDLPVVVENDVRAVTSAEQWFGAGVGLDRFAVVTVGAGIGCGLVLDGQVQRGARGVAGELGHVCVDVNGPRCPCGGRGCVEAIAATRPFLRRAGQAVGRRVTSPAQLPGLLAQERRAGGAGPLREVVDHVGGCLAAAIAAVVNLTGPQRTLVSVEGFDPVEVFGPRWPQDIVDRCFGRAAGTDIVTGELSFPEWARGAAVVAITDAVRAHR